MARAASTRSGVTSQWELERARRVLAEAVLDDDPRAAREPAAARDGRRTGAALPGTIVVALAMYDDLSERNDPGRGRSREEERDLIRDAIKKKTDSCCGLRCAEACRLSAYYGRPACELTDSQVLAWALVTGADPRASARPAASGTPIRERRLHRPRWA
jgi:hypothetical protein